MDERRERPFLDTNVLFSGLAGSGSPPARILEHHAQGRLVIVISRQILDELVGAVQRKKPSLLPQVGVFFANAPPEMCTDPTPAEVRVAERCINPKDAPILAAAIKSGATCLVSGNTRHFTEEAARCAGITNFTPSEYSMTLVL